MKPKRILIVEDQGIIAMEEAQIMTDLGYEVVSIVMTGENAILEAIRSKPDVILMDINLPGDIDGREATARIQKDHQIPVIYVTAYGDKETAKSKKFNIPERIGYIVKPFTKNELAQEIERLTA